MDPLPEILMDIFMEHPPSSPSSTSSSSSSSEDSMQDSSTEENALAPRESMHRITDYVSKTVSSYNVVELQQHFRLCRSTFDVMEGIITVANVLPEYPQGKQQVTHKEGLLISIWYLANTETFRQVSDRFGVSMDTVRNVIKKIVNYFVSQSENYIKWPSQELCRLSEGSFYQKSRINGAIGAIEMGLTSGLLGQTKIKNPFVTEKDIIAWFCRESVIKKKRFLEVFFGEPGSQHDARVLQKSNIFKRAEDGTLNIGEYFLLGDSAYPCLDWLIPPFKDDGNLTLNHRQFNYRHSSARVVIEHSFGLLKSRFRRLLHGFENRDLEFVILCVLTSCIFHNICINQNDVNVEEMQIEDLDQEDPQPLLDLHQNNQGQNKRNIIFNMFLGNV